MNVTVWEHLAFDYKISGCNKVYYSNAIIITNFVRILIPNCWFDNICPTDVCIEISEQNLHVVLMRYIYMKNIEAGKSNKQQQSKQMTQQNMSYPNSIIAFSELLL
jgi:hypothetical protein